MKRRDGSAATLFVVGNIAQRAIAVALLPLLLGPLGTHGYGVVVAVTTVASLLVTLLSLGIGPVVLRELTLEAQGLAYDASSPAIALRAYRALPFLGTAALVTAVLMAKPGFVMYAAFCICVSCFQSGTEMFGLPALRARSRILALGTFVLCVVAVGPVLRLVTVLGFHAGVRGWFTADATVAVLGYLVTWFSTSGERRGTTAATTREVLAATPQIRPLVAHQTALWISSFGDRLIVGAVLGTAALGVYGLASQFNLVARTMFGEINKGLAPGFVTGDPSRLASAMHRSYAALTGALLVISAGAYAFLHFWIPSSFGSAGLLAPLLLLSCVPFTYYLVSMNVLTMTLGEFRRAWRVSVPSVAFALGFTVIGGAAFGVKGIAAGVILSSMFTALLAHRVLTQVPRTTERPVAHATSLTDYGFLALAAGGIALLATPLSTWLVIGLFGCTSLAVMVGLTGKRRPELPEGSQRRQP